MHPQILVRRDITGAAAGGARRRATASSADGPRHRSASRGCTSRSTASPPTPSSRRSRARCSKVLARRPRGRRGLAEDARPGRDRRGARGAPAAARRPRRSRGRALLRWLADDHFTFLGYREYRLERDGDGDDVARAPCPAPASASCAPTRTCRPRSASCRRRSREGPREDSCWCWPRPTPGRPCTGRSTSTTSASRRSTSNGEVVGERRFLGLFSSRRLHRVLTRIPVIREKADAVIEAPGSTPMSHTGKALMDMLETYPRDELFQTPIDELVRSPRRCCTPASAASCGCSSAATPTAATCPAWSTCRATATPPASASGSRRSSSDQLGGETIEYTARVSESVSPGCTSSSARPRARRSRDFDEAELERRLAEAARSWRDDFVAAVHRRVRRGGRRAAGPQVRRRVPRGLQGGLPAAHRRRRPRPPGGDPGRRAASTCRSTSTIDARPGRGPAQGLPDRLAAVAVRGAADAVLDGRRGRRRAALRARGARAAVATSTTSGCATAGRCPKAAASCSRTPSCAVWEGYNESDGFNALVLGGGMTWRQATDPAGLREVHAAGRDAVRAGLHRGRAARERRHHPLLVALFEARFDPGAQRRHRGRRARPGRRRRDLESGSHALDDVASLDHDRILRSYLTSSPRPCAPTTSSPTTEGQPLERLALKLPSPRIEGGKRQRVAPANPLAKLDVTPLRAPILGGRAVHFAEAQGQAMFKIDPWNCRRRCASAEFSHRYDSADGRNGLSRDRRSADFVRDAGARIQPRPSPRPPLRRRA